MKELYSCGQECGKYWPVNVDHFHSVVSPPSLSFCSSPAGPNPSISPRYQSKLPGRWGWRSSARSHWGGLLQRAAGIRAHLPAPPGWAVPKQPLRDPIQSGTDAGICEWSLRHGHWQHLWAGCPAPLQHHRVGQKHPILPRTASLRAGQSKHTVPDDLFFFLLRLKNDYLHNSKVTCVQKFQIK